MRKPWILFLLALPLAAQQTPQPSLTPEHARVRIAQLELQVAQLQQQLHQAQTQASACSAVIDAFTAQQRKADDQAVQAAQENLTSAQKAIQSK